LPPIHDPPALLRGVFAVDIFPSERGGIALFARVSTFQGPPDQTSEGIRVAREQILPAARLQDGFVGIYLLYDRESGRSLAITIWKTEADMRASEEAALRARTESAQASGDAIVGVERYEVALQELNL
jgi:heme-degrading monooxygenase HmoA